MTDGITRGDPFAQGVAWDGAGINVALYSRHAEAVELCLLEEPHGPERRIELPYRDHSVWHAYIADVAPGQRYGFRVHGPHDPARGMRFNPHKFLLDPYAKAIEGTLDWSRPVFGYMPGSPRLDLSFDQRDSSLAVPHSVVVDPSFDWGDDRHPNTPWNETIIYELHVKGFTQQHPDIPEGLRGTYAGLAHPAAIDYLLRLGITAVELLPVHEILDEQHLVRNRLRNYWGYNSIGYFAPAERYTSSRVRGQQVREFKELVRALHRAGIEVLLDVVYNHTAEGNELGPTLSLRGIDNTTYYRLAEGRERYYVDYTGTGNSLHAGHPQALKLIMDSLRYWVTEMHVDGFRFDLAATLARELHDVDRLAAFFDIINQDPILSRVKLIAEPWDVGDGGYQVGNFPELWSEWNAEFRDTVRRFWRGDERTLPATAERLTGSSDLYADDNRSPLASINFVTAHDGFTLHDLVSYERKHNEMNGEHNRDGNDNNLSRNYGVEGPTDDPVINARREQQVRNFFATLLFSQGVPMLLAGDEIGRTQQGNNNAYAQDNELSWLDWTIDEPRRALQEFVISTIALRKAHPNLRRQQFFKGTRLNGSPNKDITWIRPDGAEMTMEDWSMPWARSIGAMLDGNGFSERDATGHTPQDATLLLLLNAGDSPITYVLPTSASPSWVVTLHTADSTARGATFAPTTALAVPEHSLMLLRAEGAG